MSDCTNLFGEGESLSSPNDIKMLLKQIKEEIKDLVNKTEAKLLLHDRKNSRAM